MVLYVSVFLLVLAYASLLVDYGHTIIQGSMEDLRVTPITREGLNSSPPSHLPMPFARLSVLKFKPSKREEAVNSLQQDYQPLARKLKGQKGGLILLPIDDQSTAMIISIWESEDVTKGPEEVRIQQEFGQRIQEHLLGPPEVRGCRVIGAEIALTYGRD